MMIAALLSLLAQESPVPDRATCRRAAAARPWAKDLRQIPSTLIDVGTHRHVPYTSYRAGDVEMNVYGDPAKPACVEVGLLGRLLHDEEARRTCLAFLNSLLSNPEDSRVLGSLKIDADRKTRNGWTFEITPPTAPDAYGGWWVSIYDEKALDKARATPEELKKITTTRDAAGASDAPFELDAATSGRWSKEDLALARKGSDTFFAPAFSNKNGAYVPDRSVDDTGWILFICANSDKHEDKEVLLKNCPACRKASTFFWDGDRKAFRCFQCGAHYDNAQIKCPDCGKVPRRVRTKHR